MRLAAMRTVCVTASVQIAGRCWVIEEGFEQAEGMGLVGLERNRFRIGETGGKGVIQNEVLNCIHARRSTRDFLDRQVEPEQLDALLDAAIWAPSGGNNQTWLFTAIQSEEKLLQLNELVREGFQSWVPDDDYPGKLGAKAASRRESYNFYYHAPTLIIASNRPNYENAMADCALALENVFLAAQSLGLGSCYINQLHWLRGDVGVRDFLFELGIPKEHTICSSAAIGYVRKETSPMLRKPGTIQIVR